MLSKINSRTIYGYSMLGVGSLFNFLFFKRLVNILDENSLKIYSVIILVLGLLSVLILLRYPVKTLVYSDESFSDKLSQSLSVMYTSCLIIMPLTWIGLFITGYNNFTLPIFIWLISQPSITFDSVYRRYMRFDYYGATTLIPSLFLYALSLVMNISEIDVVLQLLALTELIRLSLRLYFNYKLGLSTVVRLGSLGDLYAINIKEYGYALPELLIKRFLTSLDVWLLSTLPNIQGYAQYRFTREIGSYFIKVSDMVRILVLPYLRKSRKPKQFIFRLKISSILTPILFLIFIYFSDFFNEGSNRILLFGFMAISSSQVIWPLVYYKDLRGLANKLTITCYGLSLLVFALNVPLMMRCSIYILFLGLSQLLWIVMLKHDT